MSPRTATAVILAAGRGARLRDVWPDRPKGFITVGGETLIERSLRLLRGHGIERAVIVAGYGADAYQELARGQRWTTVVVNAQYDTMDSMASLARALEVVDGDFLLLESDLFYEPRALEAVLGHPSPDVLLASGPTAATDEVWVEARDGRLTGLSKDRSSLTAVVGEYVGIVRVSAALAQRMKRRFDEAAPGDRARLTYDADALAGAAREHSVAVCVVGDLLWGEIDCDAHLRRVREEVGPAVAAAPPPRRILLNPGPATTSDAVKRALVIPDVCPREAELLSDLADVRRRLARIAGDTDEITALPVVGSGTAALEAALVSFVPEEGCALVIDNGDYGARLVRICEVHGLPHRVVRAKWGAAIDVAAVEKRFQETPAPSHLVFVHHETSSGMLNPLEPLTALARRHGAAVIVDAMSSFAAMPIRVGAEGVDALVSSANKCLQGMPGLSFVVATRRALDRARGVARRSLYFDLVSEHDHLERTGQTRFTVPPQLVSALRQALLELDEEGGVEGRRRRYDRSFAALTAGLRALGFELLLPDAQQSRILVAVREPGEAWFEFDALHDALLRDGFTIYPGKPAGEPTFRLSVLGAIDERDIAAFLAALGRHVAEARANAAGGGGARSRG